MTQIPFVSLQHPPFGHGFGWHAADANHVPEHDASVDTEQMLASEQHDPVVAHGLGEHDAAAYHIPVHAASEVCAHPPKAVLQHAPTGGQRSAEQGCAG